MPFFPRVLKHLVGLGRVARHRTGSLGRLPHPPLELVPEGQQVLAVAAELAGQLGRRGALTDATQDEDQLRRWAAGLLERGAGVGVEDRPAVAAAVVEDRVAVAVVGGQSIRLPTAGAAEPVGVEGLDQEPVAGVGVHQSGDRKVHW
jgi:hypothetical protein